MCSDCFRKVIQLEQDKKRRKERNENHKKITEEKTFIDLTDEKKDWKNL